MSRASAGRRGRASIRPVLAPFLALVAFSNASPLFAAPTESGGTVSPRPSIAPPSATLDRSSVPAKGRSVALLSVERFGRVAVLARSAQGVSLQLVDRVAGPSAVSGTPGEADGRVEGFLDHGEYRVVARGDEKAQGEATLEARPFTELSPGQPPLLPELVSVATTLADFEQRSWWLHVPERSHVALEVAGRALGDLRLWHDGQWLVDAEPERATLTPEKGRLLTVLRLAPQLEPGLYLLTAYGGPPQSWARDDGSSPLHVRSGVRPLASAHRQRHVMGPMGVERFTVPSEASYFRLEIDESPASLGVGGFDPAAPFAEPDAVELITKESLPPVAELRAGSSGRDSALVTVVAPPGKAYILQHFNAADSARIPSHGRLFISTVHSGHAADSVDVTGVVWSSRPGGDGHTAALASQAIPLGSSAAWARRFNLLDRTQVYFDVKDAGDYHVEISGVDAECVIEPFLITDPPGYESPRPKGGGSTWDLEVGFHVLTLMPRNIGIADVAVRKAGLWDRLLESLGRERDASVPPLAPSMLLGEMTLGPTDHFYSLARRPGIESGLVARPVPVDLASALPLALPEGGSVTVPVMVKEASTLRAELEDGALLPLSLDGAPSSDEVVLPSGGSHRVTIQAPAVGGPRIFSLVGTPQRERSGLVALPTDLAPKPPDLPVLLEAQPRHFDLAATESRTFLMKAAEAALYRVETTGLLATAGNLRTRTVISLARATGGGSGRNFLVQQYLRSGDYHVTVSALGKSAGHLGLSLRRAAVREGGDLEDGVQANATLPGGEAIAFDLEVTERSTWHLGAVALGRTLQCRLEEDGGWPIETPGGPADITRELEPGRYRLIVLPEATTARVAALASRIADPVKREGHGPFDLPFDEIITHQWMEPAPDPAGAAERVPDRWNIVMTGTSEVSVALGNGMEGRLVPAGEPEQGLPAIVRPSRPWTGELRGGRSYVLEVTSPRRDNRKLYTLTARPTKLLPGMTRFVHAPAEVELAFDGSATTPGASLELVASGMSDVRARLTDDGGRTLAASDDAPDDWNFRFDGVPAAAARLLVEPVAAERATTRVAFRVRAGVMPAEALAVPLDVALDLAGGQPEILRFDSPPPRGLLIVSVSAREEMSIEASVEDAEASSGWTRVDHDAGRQATVVVARPGSGEGRRILVSLRSSRGGGARPRVTTAIVEPATVDPAGGDLILPRVGGSSEKGAGGVFAATLARHQAMLLRVGWPRGTTLRLVRAPGGRVSPSALRIDGDMLALDSNSDSWLVGTSTGTTSSESPGRSLRVAAERIILRPGARPENLRLGREIIGCEVEPPPDRTLRLVVVESAGARPLVGMNLNHPDAALPGTTWRGGAAAAFKDGQVSRAWMRVAEGESSAPTPARAFAVDLPLVVRQPPGAIWSGAADPSIAWQLPAAPGVMRLSLDAGTFAVLTDGFVIRSVHGSTTHAVDETFLPRDSSWLHVVRLDGSSGRHAVQVLDGAGPATAWRLDATGPLEFLPAHSGRTRVSVQAPRAASLRVIGADAAWLVRGALDVSAVDDATALAAGEAATLVIEHGLAPVAAWLEADAGSASAWGSGRPEAAPVQISAPASVALDGVATTLRVESGEPALLSLRTTHPVVARVRRAGGMQPEARAWPLGARLDTWIPAGVTEIDLRGFASRGLGGSATVSLSSPVELREGIGDSNFLPAGSARAFTFSLLRVVKVGLGIRSTSDDIDVNLFDGSGALLGSGIVQSPELQPGRYVVVVSAPAAADPVAVRPVLLGLDEPGLGPAPDIVRRYVLGEEAPPENAAQLPPDWRRWLGVPPTFDSANGECCADAESSGEGYGEEGH